MRSHLNTVGYARSSPARFESRGEPATRIECAQTDVAAVLEDTAWYAVHCRPRHEKLAGERLRHKGFEVFLPLIRRTHVHRGRRIEVEEPLFSCYLFVNSARHRLPEAGWTRGVIRILGAGDGKYTAVPADQVERIRTALETDLMLDPHPYLKEGQKVRVRCGALAGLEGILVKKGRHHQLVITIDLIAKSACVTINADDVEPL